MLKYNSIDKFYFTIISKYIFLFILNIKNKIKCLIKFRICRGEKNVMATYST